MSSYIIGMLKPFPLELVKLVKPADVIILNLNITDGGPPIAIT